MNTAIVSSLIGTVGAAFIAVLVFFLQGLRDDIRAVGARIDRLESGLRSELGGRIDRLASGLRSELGGRIDKVESGLRAELGGRLDSVESRLTAIDGKLARIEATQVEHGRLLVGMADHGERIAALEGAVAAMS